MKDRNKRRIRRASRILTTIIRLFGVNALLQSVDDELTYLIDKKVKEEKNKKYFFYGQLLLMDSAMILTDNDLDNEGQFNNLLFNNIEVISHFGSNALIRKAHYHLDKVEGLSPEDKERLRMTLNEIVMKPNEGFDFDKYVTERTNERKQILANNDSDLV